MSMCFQTYTHFVFQNGSKATFCHFLKSIYTTEKIMNFTQNSPLSSYISNNSHRYADFVSVYINAHCALNILGIY